MRGGGYVSGTSNHYRQGAFNSDWIYLPGGKNNEITRKIVQVTPASVHQTKAYMGNDDKAVRVLSVHYIVSEV